MSHALYHSRSESGHGLKIRSRGAPQLYPHLRKKLGAACTAAKDQFWTFTANEAMRAKSLIGYASSASGSAFASMGSGASHLHQKHLA